MTKESVAQQHVLIVEDEPDFAALLRSILVDAGYSVATAYNCEDALAEVRKTRPDVITLDIQMPRKSGAFFYRTLKTDAKYRNVPVVVVTGITSHDREMESIVRTFLEPADLPHPHAYLEKPVEGPALLETIEAALSTAAPGTC